MTFGFAEADADADADAVADMTGLADDEALLEENGEFWRPSGVVALAGGGTFAVWVGAGAVVGAGGAAT